MLAENYIGGIGAAPLAVMDPGVQSTVASPLNGVRDLMVDGAGRLYLLRSTSLTVSNRGTQQTLATGISLVGAAIDGAGNVFYADGSTGKIYELVNVSGAQSTLPASLRMAPCQIRRRL